VVFPGTDVDRYLRLLDPVLPGAWVYLTGSAALHDWLPDRSDLDLLVVTADELGDADIDALAALHAAAPERPYLDAVYVHRGQLGRRAEPDSAGFPNAVDGAFRPDGHVSEPVLWATLDRYGVTVRGPEASTLGVGPDPAWLREWNLGNLDSYWRRWAAQSRGILAEREPHSPVHPNAIAWAATGPGRLHATIATGDIISKTAAADYTARLLPQYADLIAAAKAWRLGDDTRAFTVPDGYAACDLVDAVTDDARREDLCVPL
jgi:hypothetical protein